ncbi:AfsR-like transcriptional regulator TcrA [Streptomyces phaeofaciens JCM 4814]|uniref:ORC1/DEAH AAA+ ATPase domain-containing protein n=1 Tax=Streptomyces phaeofaciens TaxID=68254 RepID=A0A918H1G5_9ACTN|nr:tetratricopeptide repeat protein [Streptomyces phaeofaciens]GGT32232.1 hypothetical protein GCM10010226_05520 [Streptomyces phaeofaciens]
MSGDADGADTIDFSNGTFRGSTIGKKVEHHHHYGPMPHVEDALPPPAAGFTGRDDELGTLLGALAPGGPARSPSPVAAVVGLGGVGKTALAVRTAHTARAHGWFPGGALFVDCHGYDETPAGPEQLLEALLRALGVAGGHVPTTLDERAGLYRAVLTERARTSGAVLIVVDNASHPGQVRPLLPGHTAHRVLVTSRDTMPQLGAHLLHLDVLEPRVAQDVLHAALRTADPADTRVTDDPAAVEQLCALCGHLPLALQIAAALLVSDPGKPVPELVNELADSTAVIDHLDDGERGVRAAFDLSYRRLDAAPARLFRLLGLAPGPETGDEAMTVLCGAGAAPRRELNVLVRAHLVGPGTVRGRWRMHDLVRAYAADQGSRAEAHRAEGTAARSRLLAHYRRLAEAADRHIQTGPGRGPTAAFAGRQDALDWLDGERTGLVSAALWAGDPAHARAALRLALSLHGYLNWRRYFDDAVSVFRCAAEAVLTPPDPAGTGKAWNCLGLALRNKRRIGEAVAAHTRARAICREAGDGLGEGRSLDMLGIALTEARAFDQAIEAHECARALAHAAGEVYIEASTWNNLGRALFKLGRFEEAGDAHTRACEMFRSVGDGHREAIARNNLGRALRQTGRHAEAVAAHTAARAFFEELGDRERVATTWNDFGLVLSALGRFEEAVDAHTLAVREYEDLRDQHRQAIAANDLGITLLRAGHRDRAVAAHREALALYRELADEHGQGETLRLLTAAGPDTTGATGETEE